MEFTTRLYGGNSCQRAFPLPTCQQQFTAFSGSMSWQRTRGDGADCAAGARDMPIASNPKKQAGVDRSLSSALQDSLITYGGQLIGQLAPTGHGLSSRKFLLEHLAGARPQFGDGLRLL